ncbi:MAG: sugar phosphate nucleotidyltransferase [Clostridiaceae bacterium]|nr:NTP transferase domain-containing protein [Eubacteriales bacterium]
MRAVIMAGGEGRRLRPLTCTVPKPMVPLLNRPVIEYCLELLRSHGMTDVTATLFYLPESIMRHVGNGERFGVKMDYAVEEKPLGTAGSVRAAVKTPETTLVLSGDALTDMDLSAALAAHKERGAKLTIVLKKVTAPTEYGVVLLGRDGAISRFLEKPMLSEVFSDLANTGVYILEPEILELIPEDRPFDFSMDLFPLVMERGVPIYGYETEGYWCDIGDLEQYLEAQRALLDGQCAYLPRAAARGGIHLEEGARVSKKAVLRAPCYVGSGAEIADGALVEAYAVIGSGSRIGTGSSIKQSVLMENVRVRENAEIRGAILCEDAHIDTGAAVFEKSAVGAGTHVGRGAQVRKGALIWPQKKLADEAIYTENVVWQERGENKLERLPMRGYCDGDLNPLQAVRAGCAFASLHKLPAEVGVATDGSQQAVMLKHALFSGLISQGVDVCDLGACPYSVLEYAVRAFRLRGGAFLRHSARNAHEAELYLCDHNGAELGAKDFRKFKQEYDEGFKKPVTFDRLGVLEHNNAAARAYEAHIASMLTLKRVEMGAITVIVGGSAAAFDIVARVLLPVGVRALFMPEKQRDKLRGSMVFAGATLGVMMGESGETELIIYKDRHISKSELQFLFALSALRAGRQTKFTLPVGFPEEYADALTSEGATVERAANVRGKWLEAALLSNTYLGELFEPETAVVRLSELAQTDELEALLKALPQAHTREAEVGCSWRDVGRVLRSLVETESENRVELLDGVKVKSDEGWVLIRPSESLRSCRVLAGAYSEEYSKELTDIYLDKVRKLVKKPEKT